MAGWGKCPTQAWLFLVTGQEAMKGLGQAKAAQNRCHLRAGRKMCRQIGGTQHPGLAFTEEEREEDSERVGELPNVAQQNHRKSRALFRNLEGGRL